MCLAVPAKLIAREEYIGMVEVEGITRKVGLSLVPEAKVGDFVLIHAGFAIEIVEKEEAARVLELLREIDAKELAFHERQK
ncbi:MAG: HypC/HybG/HupF family hydrogenase formation chaperone [Sporomusaceae bacterium]|jgi:hydrogenase expression/formation protein HypC|nr:HypC/HybG/HupF family hydrogenase formation chaperone [Sporomusaceae bacterium]